MVGGEDAPEEKLVGSGLEGRGIPEINLCKDIHGTQTSRDRDESGRQRLEFRSLGCEEGNQ